MGRSKYTRALRMQTSDLSFRRLHKGRNFTTFRRCCLFGVQINSSALETFTKVLRDRTIKSRYRENLVTKHSTFSYLSCDYIRPAWETTYRWNYGILPECGIWAKRPEFKWEVGFHKNNGFVKNRTTNTKYS